jgi:hypothetical protein
VGDTWPIRARFASSFLSRLKLLDHCSLHHHLRLLCRICETRCCEIPKAAARVTTVSPWAYRCRISWFRAGLLGVWSLSGTSGCGGQKPHPRAFSRSRDTLIVVVKVPGTADLTLLLRQCRRFSIMGVTSLPAIIQNLPDALLSDTKDLSQCRYRLAVFMTSADFSITFALGGSAIEYGEMREF